MSKKRKEKNIVEENFAVPSAYVEKMYLLFFFDKKKLTKGFLITPHSNRYLGNPLQE